MRRSPSTPAMRTPERQRRAADALDLELELDAVAHPADRDEVDFEAHRRQPDAALDDQRVVVDAEAFGDPVLDVAH